MKTTYTSVLSALPAAISGLALLTLAACAATLLPPTDALNAADRAVARAQEAGVADYASPELKSARDNLTRARDAVTRDDMSSAAALAEQSRLDAELAIAKTEAAKAAAVNTEMKKGNAALQQELNRNNGGKQ